MRLVRLLGALDVREEQPPDVDVDRHPPVWRCGGAPVPRLAPAAIGPTSIARETRRSATGGARVNAGLGADRGPTPKVSHLSHLQRASIRHRYSYGRNTPISTRYATAQKFRSACPARRVPY